MDANNNYHYFVTRRECGYELIMNSDQTNLLASFLDKKFKGCILKLEKSMRKIFKNA